MMNDKYIAKVLSNKLKGVRRMQYIERTLVEAKEIMTNAHTDDYIDYLHMLEEVKNRGGDNELLYSLIAVFSNDKTDNIANLESLLHSNTGHLRISMAELMQARQKVLEVVNSDSTTTDAEL